MKLHRATAKADWEQVTAKKRNRWQKLAAQSNGWLTPGNFFTLLGVILVLAGLLGLQVKLYLLSILLIVVGRLCDLADGWVADKTATKSPLGEMLDAGSDKLLGLIALLALAAMHYFPWWAALAIIGVQFAISVPVFLSLTLHHINIHPSRAGKFGMALVWVGIMAYVIAANFDAIDESCDICLTRAN